MLSSCLHLIIETDTIKHLCMSIFTLSVLEGVYVCVCIQSGISVCLCVCLPVLLTNLCVSLALCPQSMVSFQRSSVICFWVVSSLLCNHKKLQRHIREMKPGDELELTSKMFPAVTGIIATVANYSAPAVV